MKTRYLQTPFKAKTLKCFKSKSLHYLKISFFLNYIMSLK